MPVVSLKSITRITLAHGPGQFSGGAYWNGLMLKSANSRFEKSWTTQGFSFGCDTGGSAVAVLPEPITKLPEFCAAAEEPNNSIEKSIAITAKAKNNPPILGTRIMAESPRENTPEQGRKALRKHKLRPELLQEKLSRVRSCPRDSPFQSAASAPARRAVRMAVCERYSAQVSQTTAASKMVSTISAKEW